MKVLATSQAKTEAKSVELAKRMDAVIADPLARVKELWEEYLDADLQQKQALTREVSTMSTEEAKWWKHKKENHTYLKKKAKKQE